MLFHFACPQDVFCPKALRRRIGETRQREEPYPAAVVALEGCGSGEATAGRQWSADACRTLPELLEVDLHEKAAQIVEHISQVVAAIDRCGVGKVRRAKGMAEWIVWDRAVDACD